MSKNDKNSVLSESSDEHDDTERKLEEIVRPIIEGKFGEKANVDEVSEEISRVISLVFQKQQVFSGPLPPPKHLAEYEKIVPGAAERIILMAEREQEHIHKLEDEQQEMSQKIVSADIKSSKRGEWFGFIIGVLGICGAVVSASYGYKTVSILLALAPLTLSISFIYGRWKTGKRFDEEK